MIIGLLYLAALVSVPLAGGRLARLADLRLRRPGLAFAGIGVQIAVISVLPGGDGSAHELAHLASYVLLGAFAWANRQIAGVPVAALGGLLNFAAIAANGGVMPADPDLAGAMARDVAAGEFANSAALEHPRLLFLGDVLATPASWPVHNVYSVGDLLCVLGIVIALHAACGSRLAPRRRLRPQPAP